MNWKYSELKNCKIKNVDWQIKKQINTQVKLYFEKNYKNKMFYQKSHLIAQRCLSGQFRVQLRPCFFFVFFFFFLETRERFQGVQYSLFVSKSLQVLTLSYEFFPRKFTANLKPVSTVSHFPHFLNWAHQQWRHTFYFRQFSTPLYDYGG